MSRRLAALLAALGFLAGATIALAPLVAPGRWAGAYVNFLAGHHGLTVDLLVLAVPPTVGLVAMGIIVWLLGRVRSSRREVSR